MAGRSPSLPAMDERDLDNDIHRVIAKHVRRASLLPQLTQLLQDPKKRDFFLELVAAHVDLVKLRSQRLSDAQITIYDKAMLSMTLNGQDLTNTHALSLFAEEILGIVKPDSYITAKHAGENKPFGNESVARTRQIKTEEHAETSHYPSSSTVATYVEPSQEIRAGHYAERPDPHVQSFGADIRTVTDPVAEKLFATLETAKAEYQAARNLAPKDRVASAIFLRDTCENAKMYLQHADIDPGILDELEAICSMAATDAVVLSEGRKRKFDLTRADRRAGAPATARATSTSPVAAETRVRNQEMEVEEVVESRQRGELHRRGPSPVERRGHRQERGGGGRSSSRRSPSPIRRQHRGESAERGAIRRERRAYRTAHPGERRQPHYTRNVDKYYGRR